MRKPNSKWAELEPLYRADSSKLSPLLYMRPGTNIVSYHGALSDSETLYFTSLKIKVLAKTPIVDKNAKCIRSQFIRGTSVRLGGNANIGKGRCVGG